MGADAITEGEQQALKQFRALLSEDVKVGKSDHDLVRWLRARKLDVRKSEEMFMKSVKWREEWHVDSLLSAYKPSDICLKYLPCAVIGSAKDGSPVYFMHVGHMDAKGVLLSTSVDDFLRFTLIQLEKMSRMMKENSEKLGRPVTQHISILDIEGLPLYQITNKIGIDASLKILKIFDNYYPEILKRCYVINSQAVFKLFYNMMASLMAEETISKIKIYGRNRDEWIPALLEEIDAEVLPVAYGGTRTDPDGNPLCRTIIVEGGLIPTSLYMKERIKNDSRFTSTVLKRKSRLDLENQVSARGSMLRWEFMTESGDISFGVQYKTNEGARDVIPIGRVSKSSSEIIKGELQCDETGTYVVIFDNTYSMWLSKTLWYSVSVL